MDYKQAEDYILSFTDYEKIPGILYTSANYDLRRMDVLLQPLGDPHLSARTVHIAGTKGKGSTAVMIAEALIASGYVTGLYTSPHLHSLRERIRLNGALISETDFASLVMTLKPIVDEINDKAMYGQLTTFEILTALTFAYFHKKQADFQVLEVGLGGRLDATNVVKPEVCVITSISLDHTEVLGNTVAKIAGEKAGIIKPGCTVVSAPQLQEAARVIEGVCREKGAELIQVGEDITWQKMNSDLHQQSLVVQGKRDSYHLTVPLLGDHQLENAATAVAALEVLTSLGTKISAENIREGLAQVKWAGRLQVMNYHPLLVVDGAHNAYSMKRLVEAIKLNFDYDRCFVVFGTSCDKDVSGMAKELLPLSPDVSVTCSSHPRAAPTSLLESEFSKQGFKVKIAGDVSETLSQVLALSGDKDFVLVTGSLFVVAEAIDYAAEYLRG